MAAEEAKAAGFTESQANFLQFYVHGLRNANIELRERLLLLEPRLLLLERNLNDMKTQAHSKKTDREKAGKRSQPEHPFSGVAEEWVDFEWKITNHMEHVFEGFGERFMKWIGGKSDNDEMKIMKDKVDTWQDEVGKFEDAREMDAELWVQVQRITATEAMTLVRSASLTQTCGAEAWRVLKGWYDQHSRIALENLRAEVFEVERCKKLPDLPGAVAKWEIKLHRLNALYLSKDKATLPDEDKVMILKDMVPKELEDEFENQEDLNGNDYAKMREFVMKRAKRAMARRGKKTGSQNLPCEEESKSSGRCSEAHSDIQLIKASLDALTASLKGKGKGKGKQSWYSPGFKGGPGKGDAPPGIPKGKGKGKQSGCFICGGPHFARECPFGAGAGKGGGAAAEGDIKGKGKSKGKGKAPFNGYCNLCWEWGHSQRYCPWGGNLRGLDSQVEGQEEQREEEEWEEAEELCQRCLSEHPHAEELCQRCLSEHPHAEEEEEVAENQGSMRTLKQEVEHEDIRLWRGKKYLKVKAEMDTGACVPMMPSKLLPGLPIKPNAASRARKRYGTAGKGSILNEGESDIRFWTEDGQRRRMLYQRGGVNKTLAAGGAMADEGNTVMFNRQGGAIVKDLDMSIFKEAVAKAEVVTHFERDGKTYSLPMYIPIPSGSIPSGSEDPEDSKGKSKGGSTLRKSFKRKDVAKQEEDEPIPMNIDNLRAAIEDAGWTVKLTKSQARAAKKASFQRQG